jgi:hypothetical protein
MMKAYEPGRFSSTFQSGGGGEIWAFLNRSDNIVRMETATYLSRPAAEPLSPLLLEQFGDRIAEDRMKQMVGHMIRQILEHRGYRLDRSNVRITSKGNIFTSATRYTVAD